MWDKWESFFRKASGTNSTDEGCEWHDEEPEQPLVIPVEDSLDLHTFRPAEVGDLLEDYLREAWEKGFTQVRIIHGKGTGVLRRRVEAVLKRHPLVRSWRQADEARGGWGATVAELQVRHGTSGPKASPR